MIPTNGQIISDLLKTNQIINDLLRLRDAIVHADRNIVTDTIFMRDSSYETVVEKIEMMILEKIEDASDKEMMETFFEIDV